MFQSNKAKTAALIQEAEEQLSLLGTLDEGASELGQHRFMDSLTQAYSHLDKAKEKKSANKLLKAFEKKVAEKLPEGETHRPPRKKTR